MTEKRAIEIEARQGDGSQRIYGNPVTVTVRQLRHSRSKRDFLGPYLKRDTTV
jgi:hypothetical protein